MSETLLRDAIDSVTGQELPYTVELDGEMVLAACVSSNVAYAAYYAGIREYLGRRLSLRRGDRLLIASGPIVAGA